MRKQSVLLLGPALDAVSGVSTHLNQLFESRLSSVVQLKHFRVGSEGGNETALGRVWRLLYSPLALFAQLLLQRPRIVHINTSLDTKAYWRDLAYLITARTLRRKVVYQVHGGALPLAFCRGNAWFCRFLRWSFSLAQVVVLLAQEELSAYRLFVPALRVVVVPNAVDTQRLVESSRAPPTGELQLIFLGRLVETKGVFELLQCMKLLQEQDIPAHLLIVGSGPADGRIRELIAAEGLDKRVTLRAAAFGETKERLLLQAHVLLFPTYREGLPYVLLESMAAGTVPVICPVGAIPDVVRDGVHGLFVPLRDAAALADAVARLNANREELARMSAACRQRVAERYTVARLAADFASLYESI